MRRQEISSLGLRQLRRMASRRARTPDEADDLVQDTLVAALEQGREINGGHFFAWASAVIKRRALFIARTAGRRRRRDSVFASEAADEAALPPEQRLPRHFIDSLPQSVRTVALLANAGLGRDEIACVLRVSGVALRQRISVLRKTWQSSGIQPDDSAPLQPAPCGLLRRSLKATSVKLPGARFAAADPDGHEIYFRVAHKSPARGN